MSIRAKMSREFLWRLAILAAGCLAMGGWFLFDGLWTYPRQRERALEYQRLETEERLDEWERTCAERGWPTADPGEPKTDMEIYAQLVFVALLFPPGFVFLVRFLRARKRWIELTETGLRTSWGQHCEFAQIITLNKRKWHDKGIAKLLYEQNGRRRRLVLDDWKFEAEPTRAMLREVESHINLEQIVGGPPEPPLEEQPESEDLTAQPS
jgi:hypothetical protein